MSGAGEVTPGRRVRYFSGRLLEIEDLTAEQEYFISRRRLVNRTVVGDGVVAGLAVEVADRPGGGLVVRPGVAIDAWGREIVLPTAVEVVPPDAGRFVVEIRYREDLVEPTPGGEAATVVEGYELCVHEGTAPAPVTTTPAEVVEALRAGDVHTALCRLAASDGSAPASGEEPAVVLANVSVDGDGGLAVDDCGPRRVAPTNRLLVRLVAAMGEAGAVGG